MTAVFSCHHLDSVGIVTPIVGNCITLSGKIRELLENFIRQLVDTLLGVVSTLLT